jgi:hypothetical protein
MVIEWHNVGEYRFGWVGRINSSRFTVLRRSWWRFWRRPEVVAQGLIEYGLAPRDRLPAAEEPGLYKLQVIFHVDDGVELSPALKRSMAVRWEAMQRRLRGR